MNNLIDRIDALLDLDAAGALVPHGIGGHARALLTEAREVLAPQPNIFRRIWDFVSMTEYDVEMNEARHQMAQARRRRT